MATLNSPLRFLGVRPNEGIDPDDAFAVRSHVRKVIESQKRSQPRSETYHFVQQHPYRNKPRTHRKRAATTSQHTVAIHSRKQQLSTPSNKATVITEAKVSPGASNWSGTTICNEPLTKCSASIPWSPICTHPWAVIAARYVQLPPTRLDALFKSIALRDAAEPVFDPSHVDSPRSITAVFPTCLDDAAFFNALVYATVLTANRGRHTQELLHIKCRAIGILNESIACGLNPVSLAAVLILRGAAYKWEGSEAHEVHAKGLSKLLNVSSDSLTPATLRAIYWQDLFASVLLAYPRELSHEILPTTISWRRSSTATAFALPPGFSRYSHLLPGDLVACILDTLELQIATISCPNDLESKYDQLDTMQADIESRLSLCAESCRVYGTPTNAINPRLVEDEWKECRDLQLWLLMVVTSIAELDGGFFDDLRARASKLLRAFTKLVLQLQSPDAMNPSYFGRSTGSDAKLLQRATNDFIYPRGCLLMCGRVSAWLELKDAAGKHADG